jgi:hypothetical protein
MQFFATPEGGVSRSGDRMARRADARKSPPGAWPGGLDLWVITSD